jgi:hypothetical protein
LSCVARILRALSQNSMGSGEVAKIRAANSSSKIVASFRVGRSRARLGPDRPATQEAPRPRRTFLDRVRRA